MPEKLGHTVPEVLAGMAVGIFAAVLFSVWIP
jgi:acid phosphatase family membrane protein YuiD